MTRMSISIYCKSSVVCILQPKPFMREIGATSTHPVVASLIQSDFDYVKASEVKKSSTWAFRCCLAVYSDKLRSVCIQNTEKKLFSHHLALRQRRHPQRDFFSSGKFSGILKGKAITPRISWEEGKLNQETSQNCFAFGHDNNLRLEFIKCKALWMHSSGFAMYSN